MQEIQMNTGCKNINCLKILERKELWKKNAICFHEKYNQSKKELKEMNEKMMNEKELKAWWRNVALSVATIAIVILVVSKTNNIKPTSDYIERVPTSGKVQITPSHVLSSVLIYTNKQQGSGTVISKGLNKSLVLTVSHLIGKKDDKIWVYYCNGTYTEGEVVAKDEKLDLALISINSNTVISNSFVPSTLPKDYLTCVSYTDNKGPFLNNIKFEQVFKSNDKFLWKFVVKDGTIWNGSSGGGVFLGNACCGVIKERDGTLFDEKTGKLYQTKNMYSVSHDHLNKFLNQHETLIDEFGDWRIKPEISEQNENLPPLWKPSPNVPIFINSQVDSEDNMLRVLGDIK